MSVDPVQHCRNTRVHSHSSTLMPETGQPDQSPTAVATKALQWSSTVSIASVFTVIGFTSAQHCLGVEFTFVLITTCFVISQFQCDLLQLLCLLAGYT